MHAVDTNVLVRQFMGDDAEQTKRAAALFRKVSGLTNVEIEHPLVVTQALQWCDGGMDFADT